MVQNKKYLVAIVGPTAIGKTSLAIRVARALNCEIVSCDSRQFYREMSIGTAVPTPEELAQVPHHFIHNKSIFDVYTVGDFERDAMEKITELFEKDDYVVMVGGSGLYADAVLKGFDDFPEVDLEVRTRISKTYARKGIEWLQEELAREDPEYFKVVAKLNPQRLMRALDVSLSSGKPYSSYLGIKQNNRPFTPVIIGLEADRAIVYDRINERVDQMMEQGFLAEAEALFPHRELNALQTVGYRELFSFLAKDFSFEFALDLIKKNTRNFSKRQMTWFRKNPDVKWFDYQTPDEKILKYIAKQVKKGL